MLGKHTLHKLASPRLKHLIKNGWVHVKHKSSSENIYHCCVHKTGSQWVRKILSDTRTFEYSGLYNYYYPSSFPGGYDPRKIKELSFNKPFPRRTVISPLYIDYGNFVAIPKPKNYKAFFVMRDPRDIVISGYFSYKYSHPLMGSVSKMRDQLKIKPINDGIFSVIEYFENTGLFGPLSSWRNAEEKDKRVIIFRFEDLVTNSYFAFNKLFEHCDIDIPNEVLKEMIDTYSFKNLSGRELGEEDTSSHLRKGTPGDWKNYFDDELIEKFKEVTGNLVHYLGYEKDVGW